VGDTPTAVFCCREALLDAPAVAPERSTAGRASSGTRAGIDKRGSYHLLRHTTATLMMENGADLRSLQMLLSHERLNTTQIYTHVSIQRLKAVHEKTHPANPNERRERESNDD